eukprot:CAMPEP_0197351618 /NCGR_PEP_ID=MMETSP0893-20130614/32215_1 /TAXON_ID=44058 ORGANISM="Aureoumbra lagunensis, Strain CCMP1510" /NCGR_SAMPLE_ID=MMETSP0893 /ASSEMBLY_ACC=CAM_ASM_000539 /LENGTH=90 /DNA_ID=CAMNT_0042865379 /DNA_START=90 /DNA_END=363 /DNA_ORIENTATION=+
MAPHDFSTFSASFEDQRLFSERSSFFLDNEEQYDDNNKGLGEKSAILLPIDSAILVSVNIIRNYSTIYYHDPASGEAESNLSEIDDVDTI